MSPRPALATLAACLCYACATASPSSPAAQPVCAECAKLDEARRLLATGRNGLAIRNSEEVLVEAARLLCLGYRAAGDMKRAEKACARLSALDPKAAADEWLEVPAPDSPPELLGEPH